MVEKSKACVFCGEIFEIIGKRYSQIYCSSCSKIAKKKNMKKYDAKRKDEKKKHNKKRYLLHREEELKRFSDYRDKNRILINAKQQFRRIHGTTIRSDLKEIICVSISMAKCDKNKIGRILEYVKP